MVDTESYLSSRSIRHHFALFYSLILFTPLPCSTWSAMIRCLGGPAQSPFLHRFAFGRHDSNEGHETVRVSGLGEFSLGII